MTKNQSISFSEFYINEFFDQVREKTRPDYKAENFNLIDDLFTQLSAQNEITEGISKLAEEQASSELSIFLFDIYDRAQDYPPSELVDALPEIADDFVSGLTIMLEEEQEIINSIEKVIKTLKAQSTADIESGTSETESEVESEEEIPEDRETVQPLSFQEFTEHYFFDQLQAALQIQLNGEESEQRTDFVKLIFRKVPEIIPPQEDKPLNHIIRLISAMFPWLKNEQWDPAKIMKDLPSILDAVTTALYKVDNSLVAETLESGEVLIVSEEKDIEATEQYSREEVSAEPTTIDNLLSEYFQIEADEHADEFKKLTTNLQGEPGNAKAQQDLLESFQSFKEISMIHGYVILEDFCSEIMALINHAKREKKEFNREAQPRLDTFFRILKKTDKLKDSRSKTPESEELERILTYLQDNLFISEAGETADLTEEPEGLQKETKQEKLIAHTDQEDLLKILRSLLHDLKPHFKSALSEEIPDLNDLLHLLNKLKSASELIAHPQVHEFFVRYTECLEFCQNTSAEDRSSKYSELLTIYNSFSRKANPDFEYEIYEDRIKKLMEVSVPAQAPEQSAQTSEQIVESPAPEASTPSPVPSSFVTEDLSISEKETLLHILMEIEEANLQKFYTSLKSVLASTGEKDFKPQINHFNLLRDNFRLIKCNKLEDFPNLFLKILHSDELKSIDDLDLRSMEDCYRDLLKIISDEGPDANIEESLSILASTLFEDAEEILARPVETLPAEEPLTAPEPELETQELPAEVTSESGEEDLDEIFRQEADKYIKTIKSALQLLKKNADDHAPYESIEKSLHSMKSSARLMGYNDVADLSAPMEKIFEKIGASDQSLNDQDLSLLEKVISGMESGIRNEEVDAENLKEELNNIKIKDISIDQESAADSESSKTEIKEEQLFADSDTGDEDLLEIFKDESSEYITIAEKSIQTLHQNLNEPEALSQLEHAMHSMKTAAKMLGFSEIGQIADAVEIASVEILKGGLKNNQIIVDGFTRAINLIKELTAGTKQTNASIEAITSDLSLYNLKDLEASQPSDSDAEKMKVRSPELDEQTDMFVKEGWELVEKLNRDLLKLEKNPGNPNIINDLNRTIHTLKGSAQILDFKQIGILAHKIEDLFARSKNGLTENELDVVFKSVDVIQELIKSIKSGNGEIGSEIDQVTSQIDAILQNISVQGPIGETEEKTIPPLTKPRLVAVENVEEIVDKNEQFIKITTENLDNLVNMAAELVINKTQLNAYLEKLRRIAETLEEDKKRLRRTDRTINSLMEKTKDEKGMSGDALEINENVLGELIGVTDDFKEVVSTFDTVSSSFRSITRDFEQNIGQISSLSKSLHDKILQVRLVPTEMLFNRFPRAVRDMAKKLKKKVNLVVEGEQTEMDRALIESLTDPVMHLVRNAIDHGIELPAERKEKGKSEDGIILLKAKRSKNQIIIEIQDDGRGIDPEYLKTEIIKKELADEAELNKMSASEILEFVFKPGFTTRDEASDVSGRGVGLDAVANQLKKLKGDIRINSTPGKGTIFVVRVPLTLAIAQAIMVKVGEEILAIPISAVEETVQFQDPQLVEKDERAFITLRDKLIPVAYLSSLLNFGNSGVADDQTVKTAIIVREAGATYALIVDGVLGREEIVIKSLGEELAKIPYISGGTVSGDGSVILILDIPSITQKIRSEVDEPEEDFSAMERARKIISQDSEASKPSLSAKKKDPIKPDQASIQKQTLTDRAPVALIIDDSVSVRKFVSSVLEKNKYKTVLAEDGPEALEELKNNKFDIIITDLEMPKMQGFDLIAEIRKQRKYQHIPIVILTGRAGKKHKERGAELGANAYITKPFKEGDLLSTLEKFIELG